MDTSAELLARHGIDISNVLCLTPELLTPSPSLHEGCSKEESRGPPSIRDLVVPSSLPCLADYCSSSRSNTLLATVHDGEVVPSLEGVPDPLTADVTFSSHRPTMEDFPSSAHLSLVQLAAVANAQTKASVAVRKTVNSSRLSAGLNTVTSSYASVDDLDALRRIDELATNLAMLPQRYRPLPVLEELDNALSLQRATLTEYALFREHYEYTN